MSNRYYEIDLRDEGLDISDEILEIAEARTYYYIDKQELEDLPDSEEKTELLRRMQEMKNDYIEIL